MSDWWTTDERLMSDWWVTDERQMSDRLMTILKVWWRTDVRTHARTMLVLKSLSRLKTWWTPEPGTWGANISKQVTSDFFLQKTKKTDKSSTFRWCSENFIFFCFWYSKLWKTVFFLNLVQKNVQIGPKSKNSNSKSSWKPSS